MNYVVDHADKLTKVKLKSELRRHKIKFPSGDVKKKVLVNLYREFLNPDVLSDQDLLGITIETEEKFQKELKKSVDSNNNNSNRLKAESNTMPTTHDVSQLSNRELAEQLRVHGIVTGPIVVSTRKIYEKKLIQCLTGHEVKSPHKPVNDDEDEEDVAPSPAYLERTEARRRAHVRGGTPERNIESTPLSDSYRRSPISRREPIRNTSTPVKSSFTKESNTSTTSAKTGGIPLWIKLASVAVLVVIAYLVVKNMESQEDNNVPRGIEAEV
ncbi:hypothetical protein SNE40_013623 [Patella caerulea]|uniref:LEM domain-containing protein n=1 Tax=Patella caerulea TaxID=87958 RepID=A0AAN8JJP2_PATCE